MKNFFKVLIALILIVGIGYGVYWYFTDFNKVEDMDEIVEVAEDNELKNKKEEVVEEKEPEIKIFNGNDRPIAFMIDNNKNAQPQASLNSTYMVYEIIVEGGESRLMAYLKGL